MREAAIPDNEPERLEALYALLCLDTPPEERFDRIVQFAAEEFDAPIVLLSLIDKDRQWFKAKVGMDVCETPRGVSFCAHAILGADNFVILDAARDERFFDNPLVTGEPHIRFYAGAPLEPTPGNRVGTLCVIDTKPRTFDAIDNALLHTLRDLILRELRNEPTALSRDDTAAGQTDQVIQ